LSTERLGSLSERELPEWIVIRKAWTRPAGWLVGELCQLDANQLAIPESID
jgi:hypothetical protein